MEAINKVREDDDFDLSELTVKNINEMLGSERVLNPRIVNLITKLLLNSRNISLQDSPGLCLALFNLLLS